MHAVVARVTVHDTDTANRRLKEHVVPRVVGTPGFVAAYWTRKDSTGLGMMIFESEDAATAASEQIESNPPQPDPDAVSLEDVQVREVVAYA
jgi:hypothetical protein